ncbi:hypothetical protein ACKC9G_11730 [Pokkaliibacter sp. CJK22405]|uniref:hypothetical protein n=1 Tax=Pokkaliibacter sp. CJK22405 TaxID=3384615 RepID=UPI003984FE75
MKVKEIILTAGFLVTGMVATENAWSAADILRDLFTHLDSNHDHLLSRQEAKALPAVEKMFDALDQDRNKKISMEEFISLNHLANKWQTEVCRTQQRAAQSDCQQKREWITARNN